MVTDRPFANAPPDLPGRAQQGWRSPLRGSSKAANEAGEHRAIAHLRRQVQFSRFFLGPLDQAHRHGGQQSSLIVLLHAALQQARSPAGARGRRPGSSDAAAARTGRRRVPAPTKGKGPATSPPDSRTFSVVACSQVGRRVGSSFARRSHSQVAMADVNTLSGGASPPRPRPSAEQPLRHPQPSRPVSRSSGSGQVSQSTTSYCGAGWRVAAAASSLRAGARFPIDRGVYQYRESESGPQE